MSDGKRFYIAGYGLAAVLSVWAQLIWLGDPLRWEGYYWIDQLQWFARLPAIVPLLWMAGAIAGLPANRGRNVRLLHKGLIAVGGGLTAAIILSKPDELMTLLVLAGFTGILAMADLCLIERGRQGRWTVGCFKPMTAVILAAAGLFYPTPYMITTPGFTLNMNRYITVDGGRPNGSISGILVIERPAFPVDWLYAAVFPHLRIEKREKDISLGELSKEAQIQRAGANDVGSAVAFHKLGLGRGVVPVGVQVLRLSDNGPAAGRLEPGDLIVELNGRHVLSAAELAVLMRKVAPGSEAAVKLERDGRYLWITVKTKASEEDPNRAVFGIQVEDRVWADLPKKVNFRPYLVYLGGPSHGAILALTLLDQLTPGGVTFGNRVAGTGTIDANGNVGQIGGIEQKAYAIWRTGADVFFVPAGQEADARKGAPSLNIVPVRTLDDMLNWLKMHPKAAAG